MLETPIAQVTNGHPDALVVFVLDGNEFGLRVAAIERVVRAVEITPLPDSPAGVLGVINVQGSVIPVFDCRKRFGLAARELQLSDHLIVAHTAKRKVGLLVDAVLGVVQTSEQIVNAESILPHLDSMEGIVKTKGGLILIQNLDQLLSLDEEAALHAMVEVKQ